MVYDALVVVDDSHAAGFMGKTRIRTQLSAALSEEDILYIVNCFREVKEEMGL